MQGILIGSILIALGVGILITSILPSSVLILLLGVSLIVIGFFSIKKCRR